MVISRTLNRLSPPFAAPALGLSAFAVVTVEDCIVLFSTNDVDFDTHFVIKYTFRQVGFSSPQKGHKFNHEPLGTQGL
jgi:hypothetical protein